MTRKIPEKRGKVSNNVKNHTNPNISDDNFKFDLSDNRWLRGTKETKFTNFLRDVNEYSEFITIILATILPEVQKNSKDIQRSSRNSFHCHPIQQGDNAYKSVLKVIRNLYGLKTIEGMESHQQIYQIGVNGSIRIITLRDKDKNVLKPLFIDYYHLAYPNIKYNQDDYFSKKFCPIDEFINKK